MVATMVAGMRKAAAEEEYAACPFYVLSLCSCQRTSYCCDESISIDRVWRGSSIAASLALLSKLKHHLLQGRRGKAAPSGPLKTCTHVKARHILCEKQSKVSTLRPVVFSCVLAVSKRDLLCLL
jgi:hypothetical protein